MRIPRRRLRVRVVLPTTGDRRGIRKRPYSILADRPSTRLAAPGEPGAVPGCAWAPGVPSYSPRHASSECSRSVEWHLAAARADGLELGRAKADKKQGLLMDVDELDRRLNGPEAIAAAAASAERRKRDPQAAGGARRGLSNGVAMPARSSSQTTHEPPAHASSEFDDVLDQWLQNAAGLTSRRRTREREISAPKKRGGVGVIPGSHRPGEPASGGVGGVQGRTKNAAESAGQEESARGASKSRGLPQGGPRIAERPGEPSPALSRLEAPGTEKSRAKGEVAAERVEGGRRNWTPSQLWNLQLRREERSQAEACEKYCKMLNDMVTIGKAVNLKPVQRILLTWYRPLMDRIEEEQAAVWQDMPDSDKGTVAKSGAFGGRSVYGPLLVLLKADKLAVLVMHEIVSLCLAEGNKGVPTLKACKQVADLVQAEVNDLRLNKRLGTKEIKKLNLNGRNHVREVNKQAERALDSLEYADWPLAARIKLGAALIKFLLETAAWSHGRRPAFVHEVRSTHHNRRHGVVAMDEAVYSKMMDEDISSFVAPRFVPMVVPPQKWTRGDRGGYLRLRSQVMRTWGDKGQNEALKLADLRRVFDGLNCLAKVPWRVNTAILDLAAEAWERDMEVGDLPKRGEVPAPDVPEGLRVTPRGAVKVADKSRAEDPDMKKLANAYRRSLQKVKMKNANLHSLRCDLRIKMSIAEEFRDHTIYFPYNMDFRGRTYPVPPNLNILGSDFCRGVLMFDEARPLGERGLHWLKVHAANLYGEDKVSFEDRVEFMEKHIDQIRDSALRPLDGEGWWMGADKPWQCLSVCQELTAALDSPDPTQYMSRLPVHQDGSCNGLQHYAALGLDENGGAQVNLVPSSKPQDVYSGVCEVVKRKVAAEARTVPPPDASEDVVKRHRLAKMVDGKIDRKVVKQTVMTSVYGVTFVGARKQIQNQIEQKLSTGEVLSDEDEAEVYAAASYLASLTMGVLGELFQEARGIMEWLVEVAMLVAREGQPVTWVTPLGLPVQQPYRSTSGFQVQTLLQGVHLMEENEHLPVAISRQKSAFPPNFVHSLDSTHMFLTAMEMDRAGVPFAAVHDSYWVHAGHVDQMNTKLRQCFVDLYSGPILEDLYESLRLRYPTVDFPPIPARGTLKLEEVKNSRYFFN